MEMISVNGLVKVTYVRGLESWLRHTQGESEKAEGSLHHSEDSLDESQLQKCSLFHG